MTSEAERYQELIKGMIANDEPCPSPTCGITMIGHLLDGLPDHLIDLVKHLDPDYHPTGTP
jgi:hypothetical protein